MARKCDAHRWRQAAASREGPSLAGAAQWLEAVRRRVKRMVVRSAFDSAGALAMAGVSQAN